MSQHTLLRSGGAETVTTVPGGGVGVIIEDITIDNALNYQVLTKSSVQLKEEALGTLHHRKGRLFWL